MHPTIKRRRDFKREQGNNLNVAWEMLWVEMLLHILKRKLLSFKKIWIVIIISFFFCQGLYYENFKCRHWGPPQAKQFAYCHTLQVKSRSNYRCNGLQTMAWAISSSEKLGALHHQHRVLPELSLGSGKLLKHTVEIPPPIVILWSIKTC